MIIFIGIVFLFTLVSRYLKISEKILKPIKTIKSKIMKLKFAKDIVYPFYILRHPIDGHYGIKIPIKVFNQFYFIPYSKEWMSIFIHDCIECQQNKHINQQI